jgi:hypothetical protein
MNIYQCNKCGCQRYSDKPNITGARCRACGKGNIKPIKETEIRKIEDVRYGEGKGWRAGR